MRCSTQPLFVVAILAFLACEVRAQDPISPAPTPELSVDDRLEQARAQYRAEVASAEEKLLAAWQAMRDGAQQAGSREKVVALDAQRREFEATGIVPKGLPHLPYYSAVGRAERELEDALRAAEVEFTRADRIDEATKAAEEAVRLKSWRAAAGRERRYLGEQLLRNPGAEVAPTRAEEIPDWTVVKGKWLRIAAKGKGNPGPFADEWYFSPGAVQEAELKQEVDVSCFARASDAGKLKLEVTGYLSGYAKQEDTARLIVECLGEGRQVTSVAFDSGAVKGVGWVEKSHEAGLPEGTRYLRVRLVSSRVRTGKKQENNNGYYDHLSLRVVAAQP